MDQPLDARDTSGQWKVQHSTIDKDTDTVLDYAAINATGAVNEGSATRNWWGASSGPDADDCVGNVNCSTHLTTSPATDPGSDESASLELTSDDAIQGEPLQYTIKNSTEGTYHAVVIEADDFRSGVTTENYARIFRTGTDVPDRGVVTTNGTAEGPGNIAPGDDLTYAFAIVEIDDSGGTGDIATQYLDASTVAIDLYPANGTAATYLDADQNHVDADLTGLGIDTDDTETFEVGQSNPVDQYRTDQGVVDAESLLDAAADFRAGEISAPTLLDVASAFRTDNA